MKEFYKQYEEIDKNKKKRLMDSEKLRAEFKDAQLQAEKIGMHIQEDAESKKRFSTKWDHRIKREHDKMKAVIKKQNEQAIKQRMYEIEEYRKKYGAKATKERLKKFYEKRDQNQYNG